MEEERHRVEGVRVAVGGADPADGAAGAGGAQGGAHGLAGADGFDRRVRAVAVGEFADGGDGVLAALGDDGGGTEGAGQVEAGGMVAEGDDPVGEGSLCASWFVLCTAQGHTGAARPRKRLALRHARFDVAGVGRQRLGTCENGG